MAMTDPKVWGPPVWRTIDFFVNALPDGPTGLTETKKEHLLMFFVSLMELLPCERCKVHYMEYFQKHPLEAELEKPEPKKQVQLWVQTLKQNIQNQKQRQTTSASSPPPISHNSNNNNTPPTNVHRPNPPLKRGGCGCGGKKR